MTRKFFFAFFALTVLVSFAHAQQFNSVPLDNKAYALIEIGVMRGIVSAPPSAKPWSEHTIKEKLRIMLDAPENKLSSRERAIVSDALATFERKKGTDFLKGKYYQEETVVGQPLSVELGLNWTSDFSFNAPDTAIATVNKGTIFLGGDMGKKLSWNTSVSGGFLKIDREYLGEHEDPRLFDPLFQPYFEDDDQKTTNIGKNESGKEHKYPYDVPRKPSTSPRYKMPGYFPYTFSKPWEGGIFVPDNLASYTAWPDDLAFFYEMLGEINASALDNRIYVRFGRHRRDWGPGENGASLYMNAIARPFVAFEGSVIPLNWLRLSFLTGSLEYLNKDGNQWSDAAPYQNLLSMTLVEIDTGRFHLGIGSNAIYAKRLELGYISPLTDNFFYQNNIGDFDNLAMFGDIEFRFNHWKIRGSAFVDEMRPTAGNFFHHNRNMYAYQGDIKADVLWLPFGVFTFRYTKIEPYNYTHEFRETPYFPGLLDTSYLNNGESIGSYLPPNSDELLVRLEAMPLRQLMGHMQYQLIRHGVDWGSRAVPGSSLWDKSVKEFKGDMGEKYFLRDGVYQWDHVIKLGAAYNLQSFKVPVAFYAETGIVITRFTDSDIKGDGYKNKEGNFSAIDTEEYQAGNRFILSLGFKVYP